MTEIVSALNLNQQGLKRGNHFYFLIALALLVFPFTAAAQTTTSTSKAPFGDSRKEVVAGAQVVVKNAALGIERTSNTNAEGLFRVTSLPAVSTASRFQQLALRRAISRTSK
jgi:hypothetical protein